MDYSACGLSSLSLPRLSIRRRLRFAFGFGFAFTTAVGVLFGNGGASGGEKKGASPKDNAIIGSVGPMDGTSGSGAGGSSRGASLRISRGGDIVLVDSAVGAAMLASGAALAVLVESSAGADNGCSGAPGPKGELGPLRADGRCKSVNNDSGAAANASAGPGTSGASVISNASAGRVTASRCMLKAGKLRRCHKGIALRNIKRRTLKLASVRRDIHRHEYGFDLASGFASSWVNTSVDIDAG